jgi:hypothetical protein
MKKILVLLPIPRDKKAIMVMQSELPSGTSSDAAGFSERTGFLSGVEMHYLEDESFQYDAICTEFDVVAYVERAVSYVKNNGIDGILYSHDMGSLVAGIVSEKTGLAGPSLESVFLACHKYYSRLVDPSAIPFQALDIHNYDLGEISLAYPVYVKAPCLMCSHLHFIVHNPKEMERVLSIMRDQLDSWGKMFFDFFKEYIPEEKYPLAHKQVVVIEELMQDYSQCAIEGYTDKKGNVHFWAVSDINYHDSRTQAQNCYSMPTRCSPELQAQMMALTSQTIVKHGFKSGFFNVDIWHWNGEKPPKIIEVNGRAASLYESMHRNCFNSYLYKAMMHLCLGQDELCYLESPVFKAKDIIRRIFGAIFFVVTYGQGLASDYLNFDQVASMLENDSVHGMEVYVKPGSTIQENGTAGFRMAKFYLFGPSYEDINQRADEFRTLIVKRKDLSPYVKLVNKTVVGPFSGTFLMKPQRNSVTREVPKISKL